MVIENSSSPAMSHIANETNSLDHEAAACIPEEGSSQPVPCDPCDSAVGNDRIHSSEVIAKGIASVLGPVMRNFDAGVEGALKSQSVLASSIDRLTRELDKLLEDAHIPHFTQHATRLSGIRKRAVSLNESLRKIQKRIDNIEQLLSRYGLGVVQKNKQEISPCPDMMEGLVPVATTQPSLGSSHAQASSMEALLTTKDNVNAIDQNATDIINGQSGDSHVNDHVQAE